MSENDQKIILDKKIWLNALKTFGKILLCVVFVGFYLVSILFFLAPNFDAKIFKFIGAKNAQEACYVRVYESSDKITDLYNLVLFESQIGNELKELNYINELLNRTDYNEFVDKLDKSIIAEIKNKEMFTSLTGTNAYLLNRKVKCMQSLEISGVVSLIHKSLAGEDLQETTYATYVNAVYESGLDKAQKVEKINELFNVLTTVSDKKVKDLLNLRFIKAEQFVNDETNSLVDRYLVQKAVMNLREASINVAIMQTKTTQEILVEKTAYNMAKEKCAQIYEQIKI